MAAAGLNGTTSFSATAMAMLFIMAIFSIMANAGVNDTTSFAATPMVIPSLTPDAGLNDTANFAAAALAMTSLMPDVGHNGTTSFTSTPMAMLSIMAAAGLNDACVNDTTPFTDTAMEKAIPSIMADAGLNDTCLHDTTSFATTSMAMPSIMTDAGHNGTTSFAPTAMAIPFILNILLASIVAIIVAALIHRVFFKTTHNKYLPVWTAYEIAITTLIVQRGGILRAIYSVVRKYSGSLWGLTSNHQVMIDLPSVDRFLSQPGHVLSALPLQFAIHARVFGGNLDDLKDKLARSWEGQIAAVTRMFLNDTGAAAAVEKANVPAKASCFVTFSDDRKTQMPWEWSAGIRVSAPNRAVEVDFETLTRDFGAWLSMGVLLGTDFIKRTPTILDDFRRFDNDIVPLRMIGIPEWLPFKFMREGIAARTRMLSALEAFSRRLHQAHEGHPVDFDADMSDVGTAVVEMNQIYKKFEWSSQQAAVGLFGILWGQNANSSPVLFWFLTFLYTVPGLLEEMRKEVAPYVTLSTSGVLEIMSMDHTALVRSCPRLKAALFETFRLATDTATIRHVERPMTVKDGLFQHELKAGSYVTAPLSLHNRDPALYANPDAFDPERFLGQDPETGKLVARYGKLKLWGVGPSMCKGRTFAERELLSVGAAIISLWEVSPAGSGGEWKVPAMRRDLGARRPAGEFRVVIKRRVIA